MTCVLLAPILFELFDIAYANNIHFDPTARPGLYDPSVTIQPKKSPYHFDMLVRKNNKETIFINDAAYQINDYLDNDKIIKIQENCLTLLEENDHERAVCNVNITDNQNLIITPIQEVQ